MNDSQIARAELRRAAHGDTHFSPGSPPHNLRFGTELVHVVDQPTQLADHDEELTQADHKLQQITCKTVHDTLCK